jgi:RNA polymerase sigma factor (TIGR02999 family)
LKLETPLAGGAPPNPSDSDNASKLPALLYSELHRIATQCMAAQPRAHTLQPTALVHEAYLRLAASGDKRGADRAQFLGLAARAMRHVLIDHARKRKADKRNATRADVALDQIVVNYEERAFDLEALGLALERLEAFDEEMARAVEMHFFAGVSFEDIARFFGMSRKRFDRRWRVTRAWLLREIS